METRDRQRRTEHERKIMYSGLETDRNNTKIYTEEDRHRKDR